MLIFVFIIGLLAPLFKIGQFVIGIRKKVTQETKAPTPFSLWREKTNVLYAEREDK